MLIKLILDFYCCFIILDIVLNILAFNYRRWEFSPFSSSFFLSHKLTENISFEVTECRVEFIVKAYLVEFELSAGSWGKRYAFLKLIWLEDSCFTVLCYFYYTAKWIGCSVQFSSVQSLSRVRLFATPWITARQVSLSITNSGSSLRLMSIESVMPSSHLILCRPLLLLPPIPPSIRVFSYESTLRMRWPKYWSFSFSIIASKEIPGLISFKMDWLDLLAVQGTLKSLLQHHSSKASILRCSAFFTVQFSHPYMTTGKPQPWLDGP